MDNKKLAYLYLTLTVCAWGSLYVVSKFVLGKVPSFSILFFRYLIAAVSLLIVLKRKKSAKIEKKDYKYLLFIGIVGYFLGIGCQLIGIKLANASIASLVNSMNPVSIILFAIIILHEKLTVRKVISVLAAVCGAYIIIGGVKGDAAIWGIVFSLFSVISWSLMSVIVRKISSKYDPLTITTYGILIAMFCTLPACVYELKTAPHVELLNVPVIASLLYMGVICTALANVLWNKSLALIEASSCSLFYPLQPMVSVFLGWLFLNEAISGSFIVGAVLIIFGVMLSIVKRSYRTQKIRN